MRATPTHERLWPRVIVMPSGCWEWQGYRNACGYGVMRHNRKSALVHRAAWEVEFGPVPAGLVVCHHCDNPPCANPGHLFLGTVRENALDMTAKGRSAGQKRTHCPQGHPYDEMNTYRKPNGKRCCRTCRSHQDRERKAQSRGQRVAI